MYEQGDYKEALKYLGIAFAVVALIALAAIKLSLDDLHADKNRLSSKVYYKYTDELTPTIIPSPNNQQDNNPADDPSFGKRIAVFLKTAREKAEYFTKNLMP